MFNFVVLDWLETPGEVLEVLILFMKLNSFSIVLKMNEIDELYIIPISYLDF